MSYILEGLKKLEQKRRQEERAPSLLTFKEEETPGFERPKLWPFLIFLVLLLNVGVIVWWIVPWHSLRTPLPAASVRSRSYSKGRGLNSC